MGPADPLAVFQGALERAQELSAQWRYDAAGEVLRTLEADLRAHPVASEVTALRVHTLMGLATVGSETTGDLDHSLALLGEAIGLAGDDEHLAIGVFRAEAFCQMRAGNVEAALAAFDRAEQLLPSEPSLHRLRLHLNRGVLHLESGAPDAARRDLEAAEAGARALGEWVLAQKARHNLGSLAFLEGNLPLALERFASPVVDPAEQPDVAAILDDPLAYLDQARALSEAGLLDDADDMLARAIDELDASTRHQDLGEAHLSRARLGLMSGDLEDAARACEHAITHFDAGGNTLWRRRAEFTRLAIRLEMLQSAATVAGTSDRPGDPSAMQAATQLADEVAAMAAATRGVGDGDLSVPASLMEAEAALLAADTPRAEHALEGVSPAPTASVSVRLRWYRARAELAAATGRHDVQAIVHEGLTELARAQSRLGSIDLRTAIAIHGGELAELGIADAFTRGDPELVHGAVERSHASSTRLAPVRARATDRESRDLARLRRAEDALWRLDGDRQPGRVSRLRQKKARLEEGLRRQGWQRAGVASDAEVVELAAVRRQLALAGAVVASFTRVGSDLHVVRIDADEVAVRRVGDLATIDRLVEQLHSDLQAVVLPGIPEQVRVVMERSIRSASGRLDDALVGPLDVGDRPLVVVPHGTLAIVPWTMLPSRLGRATTTVPSLTQWVRASTKAALRADGSDRPVVAVAGPDLQRGPAEADAVAATWSNARSARGPEATSEVVRAALADAPILHLAAHGVHQATSPLFSSLLLADGPIFAHEIEPGPSARLVVLSSCEVGSQTVRRGDEPLGLTAALLHAGVPTVIAGVARVRDDVAHDVMVALHRELVRGVSPAEALGSVVAAAHDRGHVAPFVCVGAGLVPVVERTIATR